jgi:2-dehydropantoate 2-reductase
MPGAEPVAVIGMGAVGTLLAGALAAAGHPILACGRTQLTSITVTTDTGSVGYPVTWTDQPGALRGVRWTVSSLATMRTTRPGHCRCSSPALRAASAM